MNNKGTMKKILFLFILTFLLLNLPVSAANDTASSSTGKLSFQFRFMNIEETDYRMNFLQEQLNFFNFKEDKQLNKTLITQFLMMLDANFEWEEDKISDGIDDIDLNGRPDEIYAQIFPAKHERSYLTQLLDDYNREKYFEYLSHLQEESTEYEHIIFLGDSRFVGIRDYTGYDDRCHFICEVGTGYSWLTGTAYGSLQEYKNQLGTENTAVVINLGVNDLTGGGPFDGLAAQYAAFVNDSIKPLGFDVYYMSVNPVNDSACAAAGYTLYNGKVEDFNENLRTRLVEDVTWMDTYSWFSANGLGFSGDGLHYPAGTNQAIVDEAVARLS